MKQMKFNPRAFSTSGTAVAAGDIAFGVDTRTKARSTLHTVSLCNTSSRPVMLDRVRLFEVDLGTDQVEVFRQGFYMPGDPTGFTLLRAGQKPPIWNNYGFKPETFTKWDFGSHSLVIIRRKGRTVCELFGFVTAERFHGYFTLNTRGKSIRLAAWTNLDNIRAIPEEPLPVEQIVIRNDRDFNVCLTDYAALVADINGSLVPSKTVAGWIDWQYYREHKTEDDILRSAKVLARFKKQGYPFEHVVVDGGWCDYASEWLEPCEKFPHGMKWLSRKIRGMGLKLGLWLAPYITNVNTRIAREHPEWMVRNAKTGKPLKFPGSPVGEHLVPDFSRPEVLRWLRNIVRTMVRDWQIGYLKLDGPRYHVYQGGRLHDPNQTPTQIIRRSLEVIREECGKGVIVEGEGCYLPSIGLVDTQRTTQDNWIYWYNPCSGKPSMKENMKNDLLSGFMHNIWWHNHRENVILRDWPSPFTHLKKTDPNLVEPLPNQSELETQISAMALTGGGMLLTDPMDELIRRPERMQLAARFLPHYEKTRCFPVDVFKGDGSQPAIYHVPISTGWEEWLTIGIFNWDDHTMDFVVPVARIANKARGEWQAFEFWTESYLGTCKQELRVTNVPAHGCRIIALRPRRPHPQLLGTNLHLLQGAVEIPVCEFSRNRLDLRVHHFAQQERRIFLSLPRGWRLRDIDTNARDLLIDQRRSGLLIINYSGRKQTRFAVRFASSK